jgi:SRSO17 transposase
MDFHLDPDGQQRLNVYLGRLADVLNNKKRRASFAIYAMGILGDGERKSVEPIAARACADPAETEALHQRLLHFLVDSSWDDATIRRLAATEIVGALREAGRPIDAWLIDDTGFLKQGTHSVGVQRQYTGTAGKVTNCQIGVSLCLKTPSDQLPIDFELYLPRCWADDPERRAEALIPDQIRFRTKPELALVLLRRAVEAGLPPAPVLADAAYGNCGKFRAGVRKLGLEYGVGVDSTTKVWRIDAQRHRQDEALSVRDLALQLAYVPRGYRRVTWRDGTKKKLTARFAVKRVLPYHDDGKDPDTEREPVWLVCEWQDGEVQPTKFYFAVVHGKKSKKKLIRLIKERWRTERAYEDLKGELGLDHYEGRRYPGWHHHISVVLGCYAFVMAERVRLFPPSAGRRLADEAVAIAA